MSRLPVRLLPFVSLALAGSVALSAQTTASPAHRSAAAHRTAARTPVHPACAVLPPLSPKIPALPAGTGCAKSLYTVTTKLDYISPLVGPEVRSNFSDLPMVFTLAYVDTKIGTGELARPHMYYTVQYTGYLTDGTKFDSSLDHPETKDGFPFPYGGHHVIPGWDTGFEGMHVGGKRRLFVPYQLAYGERGHPPTIPPRSELVFDMELISQSDQPPARPTAPAAPHDVVPGTQKPSLPATPPTGTPATPTSPTAPTAPSTPTAPAAPATPPASTQPQATPHPTPHQ